jgi:hypothetical protein
MTGRGLAFAGMKLQTNLYGKLPKVYEALRAKLDNWYPLKQRKVIEEPAQ